MSTWSQSDVAQHMRVYASDKQEVGRVAEVYEDSFLIKKGSIFHHDRYIPYQAIASIEHDGVHLLMSTDEVQQKEWQKRPDYEHHLGDPLQLLYDRGHGVHDPFDETNPDKSS